MKSQIIKINLRIYLYFKRVNFETIRDQSKEYNLNKTFNLMKYISLI